MTQFIPDDRIDELTAYHPPTAQVVGEVHDTVRHVIRQAARHLNALLPESPLKTRAINTLIDAMYLSNATVAVEGNRNKIWQEDVSPRIGAIQLALSVRLPVPGAPVEVAEVRSGHNCGEELREAPTDVQPAMNEMRRLHSFVATHYGTDIAGIDAVVDEVIRLLSSDTPEHKQAHRSAGDGTEAWQATEVKDGELNP